MTNELERKKTIIYRGSLKSCNYKCSYCPFSKHRTLKGELEKDKESLDKFVASIEKRALEENIGAVMFTPYGEASIHEHYWSAMARLTAVSNIDRVGLQTNLSFDSKRMLTIFKDNNGQLSKLSLWATYHPEMVTLEEYASKCNELYKKGITISAGVVGVPANIEKIKMLRSKLDSGIYLWINKMDGLRRNYTEDEINDFLSVDIFFENELKYHKTDEAKCIGRVFVEADGKVSTCNISRPTSKNWYETDAKDIYNPVCGKKNCSCYLAYGGRNDHDILFGEYPVFRSLYKTEAVFFDIEGTLIKTDAEMQGKGFSNRIKSILQGISNMSQVFFITSLPKENVIRLLGNDINLFSGGAFASGGMIYANNNVSEDITHEIEKDYISDLKNVSDKYGYKYLEYKNCDKIYKIVLCKSKGKTWGEDEVLRIKNEICCTDDNEIRFFTENSKLQIVSSKADKGKAVKILCEMFDINCKNTVAVGNSMEDLAMQKICNWYIDMS